MNHLENATPRVSIFQVSPLYSMPGWYFKSQGCRYSVGPFLDRKDAEDAAQQLAKQCINGAERTL